MNEVFYLRQTYYNLRNFNVFVTDNPCNKYLLNSSIYRANELWQTLPSKIKNCASLQLCKDKIKTCRCDRCQCQICRTYIANVGYFWFVFLWLKIDSKQNCTVVNCKWPKCSFPVEAMYVSSWLWSNFFSYVKVFVFL